MPSKKSKNFYYDLTVVLFEKSYFKIVWKYYIINL